MQSHRAMASDRADQVLGVFKSTDGGTTWRNVAGSHFADEGQMSYGNAIAVHPADPNHVICGGVDLHVSTNGGASWRVASHWDADRGTATYAHADHHMLVMPASKPGRIYSANDGGLDVSEDGGANWTNRSNGLAVTMFYDIDVAQTDARIYGGGAQDNGTLVTQSGRRTTSSSCWAATAAGWSSIRRKRATSTPRTNTVGCTASVTARLARSRRHSNSKTSAESGWSTSRSIRTTRTRCTRATNASTAPRTTASRGMP